MAYVIGTDEAGYGPNLGPLVISASVWQVPETTEVADLYARLAPAVSAVPGRMANDTEAPIAIADSKALYQSGKGLGLLERGLWAAWGLLGGGSAEGDSPIFAETKIATVPAKIATVPRTVADVWRLLACDVNAERQAARCDGCDATAVPLDLDPARLPCARRLCEATEAAGVRLVALRSRAVFPEEFNATVQRLGSKGEALSRWTLELVAAMLAPLGDGRRWVLCDKHGGRDRYLPVLMTVFPDSFPTVICEGRQRSAYRFGPAERTVEISFQAKGESHLPTALASMASKYLRELAMRAFNEFWCSQVPGLRPTAGYPEDARRWRKEAAAVQRALGIEDRVVWRER